MSTLHVIGNGFDLYHGLPTEYYYFACYLLFHDEACYDELSEMYGFSRGILHRFTEDLERRIADQEYWRDFEYQIGNISSLWIEDSLQDDLNLEISDAIDIPIEYGNSAEKIEKHLNQWINSCLDLEENYGIINNNIGLARLKFHDSDSFVSFNYTHTLEKVYGINNILHIHGEGGLLGERQLPIIGHGNKLAIEKIEDKILELEEYDFEQPAHNRVTEYKCEKDVLETLLKPVESCKESLKQYLKKISSPDTIKIWGFSLGDVDFTYINEIRNRWPECKWEFSYYSEIDVDRIHETAKKIGLTEKQYDIFLMKNDSAASITSMILERNPINLYKKF